MQEVAPGAQDMTHKQYRYKDRVDEIQRAKNRTKSRVRSKVEHVFAVMKLKFGFVKVRYRGLKKNADRLFADLRPRSTCSWDASSCCTQRRSVFQARPTTGTDPLEAG